MPCYRPIKAFKSLERGDDGRYGITFNSTKALIEGSSLTLPCGSCLGCRLDRSREWAARCWHESQMHEQNAFLTLTFADEHLPPDYGLHIRTWQTFMKRLRKSIEPIKARFFACGEYGEQTLRPHYHALIFGYQFPDLVLYSIKRNVRLYTSKSLDKLWPYGLATIGNVTHQSAGYVARYVMKKVAGDDEFARTYYTRQHPVTGKWHQVRREFCVQSRRPGIGSTWFEKYKSDAFPSDFIVVNGKKMPVPKFYSNKLEKEELEKYKRLRKLDARNRREDNTPERLKVREQVKSETIKQLKRDLK